MLEIGDNAVALGNAVFAFLDADVFRTQLENRPTGFDEAGFLHELARFALVEDEAVDLAEEFDAVRGASISLFRSFDDAAWGRRGVASQKPVTVRALGFITAGHQIHHRMILEESYFPAIPRA